MLGDVFPSGHPYEELGTSKGRSPKKRAQVSQFFGSKIAAGGAGAGDTKAEVLQAQLSEPGGVGI